MKKTTLEFDTPEQAAAFAAGVNYVNDSAITAFIDKGGSCEVQIEDEDGCDDEGQDCEDEICPECQDNGKEHGFDTCPDCAKV